MSGLRKLKRVQNKKYADTIAVATSPCPRKLSEVLVEFAEPLMKDAQTAKHVEADLVMAILAWNISLLPEEDRAAFIKKAITSLPRRQRRWSFELEQCIQMLLERKQALFPDDKRMVLRHKTSGGPGDVNLVVLHQTVIE